MLTPILIMLLLTFAVLIRLYATRIRWMLANKIDPQKHPVRGEKESLKIPPHVQASSDNFQNLFELPVLFYVLALIGLTAVPATAFDITLAYIFVAMRAAHSLVHCTSNIVRLRFALFSMSALVLLLLLISTIGKAIF